MKAIGVGENKKINYPKTNNTASICKKTEALPINNVESSAPFLESQGRALLNLSKISFRGNTYASRLDEYLDTTDLSKTTIRELLMLTPEQREEALSIHQEGIVKESNLVKIVNKDEDVKQKMLELIRAGVSGNDVINMSVKYVDGEIIEKDKETVIQEYDKMLDFINKGISVDYINIFLAGEIEINEENINKAAPFMDAFKSSVEKGLENALENMFSAFDLCEIVEADDEQYQRAVSLLDMGFENISVIVALAETEENYNKSVELANQGYKESDVLTFVQTKNESDFEKIKDLMNKYSISAFEASEILKVDSERNNKASEELYSYGITPEAEILKLPDELLEGVLQLFKEGYSKNEIPPIGNFDFQKENLKNFIDENNENNAKWNEFMESTENSAYYKKELNKKDVNFLKSHAFENEFYNPDEYIEEFLYLKNLKTANGENILGNESFINKMKTNDVGDFAIAQNEMMYKNIGALLSIDPKSKKMEYVQTILKLIQNGDVNPSAFRRLSDLNDLRSSDSMFIPCMDELKTESSCWDVSNNLMRDIDMIGNQDFDNEKYMDKYIPTYNDEQEGLKYSKVGDAFVLEGEKYIRIKTDDDKSETIKLTKETYAKLFPPIERFLTSQQTMGNCYCIETLMSLYCSNDTRMVLLRTMSENDNGDITIKMGDYKPVTFKNGELPENESPEIYSSGANGYKLFEYAYSNALVEDKIEEARQNLKGDKLKEFNDFINSNPNDFYIYKNKGETKWTSYTEAKENGLIDNGKSGVFGPKAYKTFNNFLLGNGGLQNDVYKKLGYNSQLYIGGMMIDQIPKKALIEQYEQRGFKIDNISTLDKAERLLGKPEYFKNHQIQIGLGMHAYSLTQEIDDNGNVEYYLYNPHNQGFPIKLQCLEDLLSKTTTVTIVEKNN